MAKEINEKTFELNITNELLNLSKSFLWYMNLSPLSHLIPRDTWSQFINQSILFAEGLTQEEESNKLIGGYDVSINYTLNNGLEGRLMFLQYKAGIKKNYSNKKESKFYRPTAKSDKLTPQHISFTFNDAADGTQHSTLRNLANKKEIRAKSVMYVFPRITDKTDFKSKIGSLIYHSSFVPIKDIDYQALNQTTPISINDGVTHKYRTSYDGLRSEINYFYFFFFYDNSIISKLLSELICIQIERFAKILIQQNSQSLDLFLDELSISVNGFVLQEIQFYPFSNKILEKINNYITRIQDNYKVNLPIPHAPSKYTTIVPKEGLNLMFNNETDLSSINYQLF